MLAHRSAHRKKKHPQTRKLHPLRPQVHQQQPQHQRLSPHRNQQRSLRLNRLKKAPVDHFAEFSARATALRDQGAYAIAAMLFEEAAALAPNANEARNSHFEELACYVKAGDAAKAKEIAAKLRQSSVLTRFERIKLDAVERMS